MMTKKDKADLERAERFNKSLLENNKHLVELTREAEKHIENKKNKTETLNVRHIPQNRT